jgi:hypothetical protein
MTVFPTRGSGLIVLALMFCLVAHAQRKDDGTAEVFGVVKGSGGAPVAIHLRSLEQNPVRYYDGYAETTEKDGSFHFAHIAPGAYQFETTSGFMLPAPIPITLRAGEKRRGVAIQASAKITRVVAILMPPIFC